MMDEINAPLDVITVSKGQVVSYQEWVLRNKRKRLSFLLVRFGEKFIYDPDPEDGEDVIDSLDEILSNFHSGATAKFRDLFALYEPTEDEIRRIGFGETVKINFQ